MRYLRTQCTAFQMTLTAWSPLILSYMYKPSALYINKSLRVMEFLCTRWTVTSVAFKMASVMLQVDQHLQTIFCFILSVSVCILKPAENSQWVIIPLPHTTGSSAWFGQGHMTLQRCSLDGDVISPLMSMRQLRARYPLVRCNETLEWKTTRVSCRCLLAC